MAEDSLPKMKIKKEDPDEKLDTNFDSDSLQVYGAMLSEQLEKGEPGKEIARPQSLVGEIVSEEEKARRNELRARR